MKHFTLKKRAGYLSLISVVLIIIAGVVATSASHLFVTESSGVTYNAEGTKALFIAEAGIQATGFYLVGDNVGSRIACNAISSSGSLSNVSTGEGTFDVDQVTSAYYVPTATLSSSASSGASSISVSSTVGYADEGRVMVNKELMDYTGTTASTFTGLRRGVAGTTASSHASGSRVSQYQCTIESIGSLPDTSNTRTERTLRSAYQLQEAWLVGADSNSNTRFRFARWNRPTQTAWNNATQTVTTAVDLRGISMLNHGEGWAVGDVRSGAYGILVYDPVLQNWQTATGLPTPGSNYVRDLWGVDAVSHNEAWAVGERSNHNGNNRKFTILKWTGSAWCLLDDVTTACTNAVIPSGPPTADRGRHLYGVEMLDTDNDGDADIGFAVGEEGYILTYDGSTETWSVDTSGVTNTLRAVDLVSTSEAWAVGNSLRLLEWNGSTWSTVTLGGSSLTLRDIHMVDTDGDGAADYGWIVGNNGRLYSYNGSSWSGASTVGSGTLYVVNSFGPNDAWTAGQDNAYYHWDGSSWSSFSSSVWNQNMYDIAIIAPLHKYKSLSSWEEIFP